MAGKKGRVFGHGAFQLFGSVRRERVDAVMTDIFGRADITTVAADWRGIVYFTLADDEPDLVRGFDPSSGASGELATLGEVETACASGDIVDAVAGDDFREWLTATGRTELAMGTCVAPELCEFLGGDADDRADEPGDLITYIAVSAALMGRLEALGVQPGEEIPADIFDDTKW